MGMPRRITRSIAVAAFGLAALTGTTQATAADADRPVGPADSAAQDTSAVTVDRTKEERSGLDRTKEERSGLDRTKEERSGLDRTKEE